MLQTKRADDDIPDVTLIELVGFAFDMTQAEDCELFALCLAALGEADRMEQAAYLGRVA